MKKLAIWLAVILLIPVVAYGLYRLNYPTFSWHQKLILVVETPDGVKTGSAVVALRFNFETGFPFPDAGGLYSELEGEATVVDLGNGRYLFALLRKKDTTKLARVSFPQQVSPLGNTERLKQIFRQIEQLEGVGTVPMPGIPLLVTFGDVSDPASVKRVDPGDLAATFGPGFALREGTLEITDEPVTVGGVGVVTWL